MFVWLFACLCVFVAIHGIVQERLCLLSPKNNVIKSHLYFFFVLSDTLFCNSILYSIVSFFPNQSVINVEKPCVFPFCLFLSLPLFRYLLSLLISFICLCVCLTSFFSVYCIIYLYVRYLFIE